MVATFGGDDGMHPLFFEGRETTSGTLCRPLYSTTHGTLYCFVLFYCYMHAVQVKFNHLWELNIFRWLLVSVHQECNRWREKTFYTLCFVSNISWN